MDFGFRNTCTGVRFRIKSEIRNPHSEIEKFCFDGILIRGDVCLRMPQKIQTIILMGVQMIKRWITDTIHL